MDKHILLYTDDPGIYGAAQYNHAILLGLKKLGYRVTCVQSKADHALVRERTALGIEHKWIEFDTGKEFGKTLNNETEVETILTENEPDLLVFSDCCPISNFAAKQVAISKHIPYIVVESFVAPYLAERFSPLLGELSKQYAKAKSVVAVSEENLELLHVFFKLERNKGQVIYYGRPENYFSDIDLSVRQRLRQQLGIPPQSVVCFTSGRLEEVKGYQYQLEAIKQLQSTSLWSNLYFVWAGGGSLQAYIKQELASLGASDRVKLLGECHNIPDWLNIADIFILASESEGMPIAVIEAMAKGLPVIASAVSGIPEELGETGKLIPSPLVNREAAIKALVQTIEYWSINSGLRKSIGRDCKKRAENMFKEERMVKDTINVIQNALLPRGDYVSPGFSIVQPDRAFPNMIVGNTSGCDWPYLRREIPHNWYVDGRWPTVGFLSRDEAHILYNTALKFQGQRGLEIGCWMGWSACHLALAGVQLDVIDPLLARPEFYESVSSSLTLAGVRDSVNLLPGYSPQKVEEFASESQPKWSLIFIDGDHEGSAPLNDAIICEQLAPEDALILFHDLSSPDVARGLDYLKEKGWKTMVYQTMQIMGVAWRGNVEPVMHQPDPQVNWKLPKHLEPHHVCHFSSQKAVSYKTQDSESEFEQILATIRPYTLLSEARLFSLYSLAKQVCLADIPGNFVECGTYKGGAAALLATVIKRYSKRARHLYCFDTFEGMPDPTEVDMHDGVPANDTGFGAGTLKAPLTENLHRVSELLEVQSVIKAVPGLFAATLPQYKSEIGAIAFLHAYGDWYESTMDIFTNLFDSVMLSTPIQVDDYGHWEGCRKALHDFEELQNASFLLHKIDYTGVWFQKSDGSADSASESSDNDRIIPPEIKNDEFYYEIQRLIQRENIETILEVGASSGEGSTQALVTGIQKSQRNTQLFCVEALTPRFNELEKRYADYPFVKCYNVSSVSLQDFPSEEELIKFYNSIETPLRFYPLEQVLDWLRQDIENVRRLQIPENGIACIKQENQVKEFDLVLIDGSEFTGLVELQQLYGAKFILLDDINTFKNYESYQKLIADPSYERIAENRSLRHGYAIFKRKNVAASLQSLPIHFLTIVINGEPFIRYHIDIFKQLPFQWHWHIVEGVADLKHDTAWSLKLGGQVNNEIHENGISNDGTSKYLDELAKHYPENITIYRQPEGKFWDGKKEMVNAPLSNIKEECLLFQIDVDELWTLEQLYAVQNMFVNHPEKTAAFYWCWYFVGEDLLISTRNCYAQNPQQDWLRTWRYKPGMVWAAHEPPILVEPLPNGEWRNVAAINCFSHEETEELGLVFQHFAYVMPKQLQFKEQYYGYKDALNCWNRLQEQNRFPALLREFLPWVRDNTLVDTTESLGIPPIARQEKDGNWHFVKVDIPVKIKPKQEQLEPKILVDGVFFQLYNTGIARVWRSLLAEWVKTGFANHVVVLDRNNTAPKIDGVWYRTIPAYSYDDTESDRAMLQQICDEEGASLFVSTYYTTPLTTPSVFMAYDMIPEVMKWDLNNPMWREKHYAIQHASSYISISENTATDIVNFFPEIAPESVQVAYCGVQNYFTPATNAEIETFKTKYGIRQPYFMLVGIGGYKNPELFLKAFKQLPTRSAFDILLTGASSFTDELRNYTAGSTVHFLQLSDAELRLAYSGAIALVYPSKYEGFGLPVLEALACGCPVITCPNASIPEVAGEAALYVDDEDVDAMADALCEVQKPTLRELLISAGLEQAQKFSWSSMADKVSSALIDATLSSLNLNQNNLIVFPDWTQPEENLGMQLMEAMHYVASSSDKEQTTLLIDLSNTSEDEANLMLSSVAMNLMMEAELDVADGPEISLISDLSSIQWQALLPKIQGRIVLQNDNEEAIANAQAQDLPVVQLVAE